MAIYVKKKMQSNHIKGNDHFEGVSLEKELKQINTQGIQPDRNITQVFYTQRKDGVLKETDIRTDRWEIGQDAMDHVNKEFQKRIDESLKTDETAKAE